MSVKKIFTHEMDDLGRDWGDADSLLRVIDRLDQAIYEINDTKGIGFEPAENNPEILAGFVLSLTIDYNAHLLVKTMQDGFAAIVNESRKARQEPRQ